MRQLITTRELAVFRRAAEETGASVKVLAEYNESYEHRNIFDEVSRHFVGRGSVYVEITDADGGEELTGFWARAHGQGVPA